MAIGRFSGRVLQGTNAVALGVEAGNESQASGAIAIGYASGTTGQGVNAIAIGQLAAFTGQKSNAIAIGDNAGRTNQGADAIAIGRNAGITNQHANSIVINVMGTATNSLVTQACYINPIRGVAATTPVMTYDATNKEVRYNSSSRKYKTDIIDLPHDTQTIYNVQPREFLSTIDGLRYIGFVAEELEEVDTHFAWKDSVTGSPESVEWFNMLIYVIAELKKLRAEINILKS